MASGKPRGWGDAMRKPKGSTAEDVLKLQDEVRYLRASCEVLKRRVANRDSVIASLAETLKEDRLPPGEAFSDDVPF